VKSCSFRQLAASQIQFPAFTLIRAHPRHPRFNSSRHHIASHCVLPFSHSRPFASIRGSNLSGIRLRPLRSPVPCVLCVLCGLCGCLFHSSDPEPAEASFRLRLRHVRLPVFSVFSVALCEIIPHTEPQRHRGSFAIAVDGPAMPSFIMARPEPEEAGFPLRLHRAASLRSILAAPPCAFPLSAFSLHTSHFVPSSQVYAPFYLSPSHWHPKNFPQPRFPQPLTNSAHPRKPHFHAPFGAEYVEAQLQIHHHRGSTP
jgi:hypothetical protein